MNSSIRRRKVFDLGLARVTRVARDTSRDHMRPGAAGAWVMRGLMTDGQGGKNLIRAPLEYFI